MNTVTGDLSRAVGAAFEKCGFDPSIGTVTVSDRPELCQFQSNGAFRAAKEKRMAPLAAASMVAEVLNGEDFIAHAEAVKPGFINITLTDGFLCERCRQISQDPYLGVPQLGEGRTLVVDYGGPNVAKPLHVGHLRAAIIGEAVKRIASACGMKAIGDTHMGDWGLQMGLVIAQLNEEHPDWRCFSPDFEPEKESAEHIDVNSLNEIYPKASQRSKTDEVFSRKAHEVTALLQSGHPGYTAVWKEIMRVSVEDLKRSYDRLNVHFELWYGESDSEKYVPRLMDILRDSGQLVYSDGAQVVHVQEEGDSAPIPPVIIKKSDNSNIYATTDLATILQRRLDFSPDAIWYVVDKRQSLHFTQVFRCARKTGVLPASTELLHLGFGTMNGRDGKPYKTREGGVMQLSVLLDTVTGAAMEKLRESEFVSGSSLEDYAERVGVAALKFGDLINHRTKDYIFDIDKFLSFEGKTGVYLLYTVTRMNSILKKAGTPYSGELWPETVTTDTERELILSIIQAGEAFQHAFEDKAPNHVCECAYRIASAFSRFYHENHILTQPDPDIRRSWLALCHLSRRVLVMLLDVLAIETVENM